MTGEFGGITVVEADRVPSAATPGGGGARTPARLRRARRGRFAHVDERLSSRITLSSLTAATATAASAAALGATRGDAREVCLRAARAVFPDAFDHVAFDLLVTDRLYGRLQTLNTDVKRAAEATLADSLIGSLYSNGANLVFTQSLLSATRLRIAGAPRGTWAGIAHEFQRPELTSSDGALLMLLKQARAVFLDRMYKAVVGASVCEHPPLFDALERNAYLLMSSGFSCAMLFPGS